MRYKYSPSNAVNLRKRDFFIYIDYFISINYLISTGRFIRFRQAPFKFISAIQIINLSANYILYKLSVTFAESAGRV